jgi:glyoxylate reductase
MRPNILVTMPIPEEVMKRLSSFADVDIHPEISPINPGELIERVKGKSALISVLSDKIDQSVIEAGAELKVIGNYGVGFNNVDVSFANKRGVAVLNTPGVLTETTADLTWALMMGVARRLVEGDKFTRENKFKGWAPTLMMGSDIYGKTLGIIGMGRIGQAVAKRAAGFDMKVVYHKRNRLPFETESELSVSYSDLDDLLKISDFVVLLAPLTDETLHMMDASKLKLMKKSAILINVGRGPLVDEAVLTEFLKERKIAGAGFDVFENEPTLTPGLAALDNAVLLPHIGSATVETRTRMGMMIVDGIKDVLEGRIPSNLIKV